MFSFFFSGIDFFLTNQTLDVFQKLVIGAVFQRCGLVWVHAQLAIRFPERRSETEKIMLERSWSSSKCFLDQVIRIELKIKKLKKSIILYFVEPLHEDHALIIFCFTFFEKIMLQKCS